MGSYGRRQSEWSYLSPDLLRLIVSNFTDFLDYLRFRCVCSSWRSAAPLALPLLLLPSPHNQDAAAAAAASCSFFNPSDRHVLTLQLMEFRGKSVCGSPHGWLLLLEAEECCLTISVLNPVTRDQIHLPPLPGLQSPFVDRALLSASPGLDPAAVVAVWVYEKLAFLRIGDPKWTVIEVGISYIEGQFAYHDGLFFFARSDGTIRVINADSFDTLKLNTPIGQGMAGGNIHMVVSAGVLFLVVEILVHYRKRRMELYKLEKRAPETMTWLPLKDGIGDTAFFLSLKQSMAVTSPSQIDCKANCIYHAGETYKTCSRGVARVANLHVLNLADADHVLDYRQSYWQAPKAHWTDWRDMTGITWFIPSSR